MHIDPLHPKGWAAAKGYSNGMLVEGASRLIFVAGQIAWDADQQMVGVGDFPAQFRQAMANVIEVVNAGGGLPEEIVRLTMYVTDKRLYLDNLKEVGAAYRDTIGRHYPAMALVQVAALVEDDALIEIEATAALK